MSHFITVSIVGVAHANESRDGQAIKLGIDSIQQIVESLNEKLKDGQVLFQCIIAEGSVAKPDGDPYADVPEDVKLAALEKFKQRMLDKALCEEGRCDCDLCQKSWQVLDAWDQGAMDIHEVYAAVSGLRNQIDQIEGKLDAQVLGARRFRVDPADPDGAMSQVSAWLMDRMRQGNSKLN